MSDNRQTVALEDVIIYINGTAVGGCQSLEVSLKQDNKVIREGGNMKPREIKRGPMSYEGTMEMLYLDNVLLKSLIDFEAGNNPYFTCSGETKDGINRKRKVKVIDAVCKGTTLSNLTYGSDGAKLSLSFDGPPSSIVFFLFLSISSKVV